MKKIKKLKIVVYAICRNESKFVKRWVESMSEADDIIVTDTGSTDNSVELLRKQGVTVYSHSIDPWRFDTGRNLSLSHVPDDTDICVCTDLDETFRKGWRNTLESAWAEGITMANYLYNWSLNPNGTPGVQLKYFKIHTKTDYQWVYPVHECLKYIGPGAEKKIFINNLILDHFPDQEKSRSSYLNLLKIAVKEEPLGSRMHYYLGREYMYQRQWDHCINTLTAYLSLPGSTWKEERCSAMRFMAKSYYKTNNQAKAYEWFYKAIGECSYMREPYIEFAQTAYELQDWPTVYYMALRCLTIKNKSMCFTNMGYAWDHTPYDLLAISCFRLGMYQQSYTYGKLALALSPENNRLRKNLEIIGSFIGPPERTDGSKCVSAEML